MNNKFFFLIAFVISFSFSHAENLPFNETSPIEICQEDDFCIFPETFSYVSIGVGPVIFIPNVGIGYRRRDSRIGFDTGFSFSTIGYAHQLSAYLTGHYYLNPSRSSPYLGLGLIGGGVFTNHKDKCGTISPDFVFGKHLRRNDNSHHFIEMHIAIPTIWKDRKRPDVFYLPLMYIKYGISF